MNQIPKTDVKKNIIKRVDMRVEERNIEAKFEEDEIRPAHTQLFPSIAIRGRRSSIPGRWGDLHVAQEFTLDRLQCSFVMIRVSDGRCRIVSLPRTTGRFPRDACEQVWAGRGSIRRDDTLPTGRDTH